MKPIHLTRIFVFLLLMPLFSIAQQGSKLLFLPWFDVINLKGDYGTASTKILRGYLEESGRYKVVIPSYGDSTSGAWLDPSVLCKMAMEKGASQVLLGTLTRLGETVLVEVRLLDANNGSLIWSDKMRANNPDDIDPILMRVGKAVGTPMNSAATGDIYSVTQYDSKELRKHQANYSFGVSVGGMLFTSPSSDVMGGMSFVGSYDIRDYTFDLRGSYYGVGAPNYDYFSFGLEVNKPFTKLNNTPFVGGGVSLAGFDFLSDQAIANYSTMSQHTSGVILQVGGGYILNRMSSAQLRMGGNFLIGSLSNINSVVTAVQIKLEILFNK